MKKMLFLVLALASAMVASAQNQEEGKTLYVINGEVVSEEVFKNMPAEEVKDTQIVKGVERVMLMRTAHPLLHFDATPISADKEPVVIVKKRTEGNSETKSVRVVAAKNAGEDGEPFMTIKPLYIQVDGENNVKVIDNLDSIHPLNIDLITVLKNEDAKAFEQYGDVSDGVVFIKLKQ
ncbi:MAG: hypothetical protein IJ998_09265 [Alistipes sp.]|nr:hypothetical protein [Alistipes sp.]